MTQTVLRDPTTNFSVIYDSSQTNEEEICGFEYVKRQIVSAYQERTISQWTKQDMIGRLIHIRNRPVKIDQSIDQDLIDPDFLR